jgi:hypothetical protein
VGHERAKHVDIWTERKKYVTIGCSTKKIESKSNDKKIVAIKLKILNNKEEREENHFAESSVLVLLTLNIGAGTLDWGFLSVPFPSQVVCCVVWQCILPLLSDSFRVSQVGEVDPSVSLV